MVAHPIVLRGIAFDPTSGVPIATPGGAPAIFARTDRDFVRAMFAELATVDGRKALARAAASATEPDGALHLYQPVHRTFYVALFEAVCDIPGEPRVDPARIDGAGLVVRRVGRDALERWVRRSGRIRGWRSDGDPNGAVLDDDPDPARRGAAFATGHPEIDRRVEEALGGRDPFEESVTRLFPVPPEVCAAVGRTLLFAVVPVTSAEAPELDGDVALEGYDVQEIKTLLPLTFAPFARLAGMDLDARTLERGLGDPDLDAALSAFGRLLRTLAIPCNLDDNPALVAALDRVSLAYDGDARPAGGALQDAAAILLRDEPEGATFRMPAAWPALTIDDCRAIHAAAKAGADARMSKLAPRRARFDAKGARYRIRGFLRARRDDGCPPRLVWSAYGAPFSIAPWHETGPLPPVTIALPEITRESVKSLLPNVAFEVPKSVFGLLDANKPEDIFKGDPKPGEPRDPSWLCGFNIPIITICAFVLLNLVLGILNLIFWWLPFVKICIPLPPSWRRAPTDAAGSTS
jgi:hypothetical protein